MRDNPTKATLGKVDDSLFGEKKDGLGGKEPFDNE